MTGYGKATGTVNHKKVTIEIKSLNSKQTDISVRMPSFYKEKELPLRTIIQNSLDRGKIEFNLFVELPPDTSNYNLNTDLFKKYYTELSKIATEFNEIDNTDLMSIVAKMPDILKPEKEELDETEWQEILKINDVALKNINAFRITEGSTLEKELKLRINNILALLLEVDLYENNRVDVIKERIYTHLKEALTDENVNKDRLEQELIYYIEKYNITEEKIRLKSHLDYFSTTLKSAQSQGKKLGFITQEMGREINTLGSKANDANLQKVVVQMKDELEKIKEQILNIL